MRVSWQNLEWLSERDQAEIQSRLESLTGGAVGLDRVDMIGGGEGPLYEARILAKVGRNQIRVVRKEGSREQALRSALTAFEASARWMLASTPPPSRAAAGESSPALATSQAAGGSRKAGSALGMSLPMLRLLEGWTPWGRDGRWGSAAAGAKAAATSSARNKNKRTAPSRSKSGARRGARRKPRRRRIVPLAAALVGFFVFGFSAFEIPTLILERPAPVDAGRSGVAFQATATDFGTDGLALVEAAQPRGEVARARVEYTATASLELTERQRPSEIQADRRAALGVWGESNRVTRRERSDRTEDTGVAFRAVAGPAPERGRSLVSFGALAR